MKRLDCFRRSRVRTYRYLTSKLDDWAWVCIYHDLDNKLWLYFKSNMIRGLEERLGLKRQESIMNQEIQKKREYIDRIGLRYQRIVTVVLIISMLGAGMWLKYSPPMAIVLGFIIFVVSTVAFNRIIKWERAAYAKLDEDRKRDL